MKKTFALLSLLFLVTVVAAQSFREEMVANPCLGASNYLAYPSPSDSLTPAPDGYKPFYISHYGRHGSRYLISERDYTRPIRVLERADSAGVLTERGRDLLGKIRLMYGESMKRWGELTELGAEQHRQIARRMYARFPEVFTDTAFVDARSTVVIRCILSMENELQELLKLNPRLRVFHDASEHDMHYMNFQDKPLFARRETPESKAAYDAWCRRHTDNSTIMARLFNDGSYVSRHVDSDGLAFSLFSLARIVQNSEIRHQIDLWSFYTPDEIYRQWQQENVWWYLHYAAAPQNGAVQPFSQRNLLRNIITEADSCIRLGRPGATLRFGHETMVMPLVCLMNVNGYGRQISNLDSLEACGWVNSRIFPMGANVQLVFYRSAKKPDDILVKVLLNENEAVLPDLKPTDTYYYRWDDFRNHFLDKLAAYETE